VLAAIPTDKNVHIQPLRAAFVLTAKPLLADVTATKRAPTPRAPLATRSNGIVRNVLPRTASSVCSGLCRKARRLGGRGR
jgi:hypothetical protein